MSNNNKISKEELKNLEDKAYFELCQIIAEAMQLQDIELLNARISIWKNKYKSLLDGSISSSSFKKRIEFLLNQYYSEVTQYILKQIKFKEEKTIENQSKALKKLYRIIKDTNDLALLKEKVKKWESEYPISAFLDMYKRKIKQEVTTKNLERNAFDQEKAFKDLIQITKKNGTVDELKYELEKWEKEYSINNKYTIDDFLKNKSEIKRYTSDEYLRSISNQTFDQNGDEIIRNYNDPSTISKQATAYTALLSIANKPNNVDQVFNWVYKYNSINFNDKYKELILAATYLDYSPTYLTSMPIPKIDLSKFALSFDEYQKIMQIKRYAAISYFNLLLPSDKVISNNYFNNHIQSLYYKTKGIKQSNSNNSYKSSISENEIQTASVDTPIFSEAEVKSDATVTDSLDTPEVEPKTESTIVDIPVISEVEVKSKATVTDSLDTPEAEPKTETEDKSTTVEVNTTPQIETNDTVSPLIVQDEPLDHNTIIALSPEFFEEINYYSIQANLIDLADQEATKYASISNKSKSIDIDKIINKSE